MGFFAKFKRNKNRICAIGFAGLGLLFFFAYYGVLVGLHGFEALTNEPSTLFNMIITAIIYFMIFVYNCNNDGRAFGGVSWFIFVVVFNQIYALIISIFVGGSIIGAFLNPFVMISLLFAIGQIVVGVLLYTRSRAYMALRYSNFKRIRILFIIFLVMLAIQDGLTVFPMGFLTSSFLDFAMLTFLPIADFLIGISCAFTMERLRRY